MDTIDVAAFLREREEKLGGKIIWRSYCTWYARLGKETREYGVLIYSDGKTIAYEDFEREPAIMGIPIRRAKRKGEEYVKLEVQFPAKDITDMTQVTWASAAKAAEYGKDISRRANGFDRIFRRLATKITLKDGTVIFIEPFDHKELSSRLRQFREST